MSLDGLRRRQTDKLTDRCKVTRGTYPDHAAVETDLPCLARTVGAAHREVEVAAGEKIALPAYRVRVPHDADVQRGDVIEVTSSPRDDWTGRYLTVVDVTGDSLLSTRVALCREQQE